jgi:hypothetical protein
LYPNPSKDKISIYPIFGNISEIKIYSIEIKLINGYKHYLNSRELQIDISNLEIGIYILTLMNNEDFIVKKFVKN